MINCVGNAKIISDKLQVSKLNAFQDIHAQDSVSDMLTKGNVYKLAGLIRFDKPMAMVVISSPKYSSIVYENSTGRTLGHEAAKRHLSASMYAAQNEKIWHIADNSGWSIGHEAVLCREEIARYCINNPGLFEPKTSRGVSVAETILLKHANALSEQDQKGLRQYIIERKKDHGNIVDAENAVAYVSKENPNDIRADSLSINIRTNTNANSNAIAATAHKSASLELSSNKNEDANSHSAEDIEIEFDLKSKLSKNGAQYIMQMLKDDAMLSSYIIKRKIGLQIKLDDKGDTIAHFLAKINEEYATALSLDYETAKISNASGWSVCHEGVNLFNTVACAVMKSEDRRLWELCDERGKSVGGMAVRHHENVALLAINSDYSQSLLSIENDDGVSAAHEATKWKSFSIEVLNRDDIFSMRTRKGESVAEWAVRRHKSSAVAFLRDKGRYIGKLGAADGDRLAEMANEIIHMPNLRAQ